MSKTKTPMPFDEVRRAHYRIKIMGILWFEGDMPQDPDEQVWFSMNPNATFASVPSDALDYSDWSEEQLAEYCRKMPKPKWVNHA